MLVFGSVCEWGFSNFIMIDNHQIIKLFCCTNKFPSVEGDPSIPTYLPTGKEEFLAYHEEASIFFPQACFTDGFLVTFFFFFVPT